jgi:hypothetical protein
VAAASPSPPHPTLAQSSQNHRFDIPNLHYPEIISLVISKLLYISLLHGNASLYRIWRLNHHGEDHSSDSLKRDLKDIYGENIS